eukprot:1088310-Pyramimonas_sp.AAC.1
MRRASAWLRMRAPASESMAPRGAASRIGLARCSKLRASASFSRGAWLAIGRRRRWGIRSREQVSR